MRKFSLLVLLFSFFSVHYGQIDPRLLDLPKIMPPSPDAASLIKYGSTPVNMSTGSSTVDVPIWSINCGSISWPLSISYTTAAIKVDEVSSSVGLGWTLVGQGVITRAVRGRPDEEEIVTEPDYSEVSYANDWYFLYNVVDGTVDSELDIYSYSFNGRSGKFYITQSGEIFATPVTTLKISLISSGFQIIDEEGNIYSFFQKETSPQLPGSWAAHVSSWYLTKVETSDKKQAIDFHYIDAGTIDQSNISYSQRLVQQYTPVVTHPISCGLAFIYDPIPVIQSISKMTNVSQLQRIDFPNGSINFSYTNDRVDLSGTYKNRLTKIDVKRASADPTTKVFSLYQSYYTPNYKMRLDSIHEYRFINGPIKKYSFEYNTTSIPSIYSNAQDKWGFYNGKTTNQSLLVSQQVWYSTPTTTMQYNIGNANRSVDTTASKAGTLIAVNWPTGGRTVYTYDAHQFYPGHLATSTTDYLTAASTAGVPDSTTFTYPLSMTRDPKVSIAIHNFNTPGSSTPHPYVEIKDLTTGSIILYVENNVPQSPLNTEQSISLIPGRSYQMKSEVYTNATLGFNTRLKVEWSVYSSNPAVEKGGGIRVRTISNYTKSGVLASTDHFEYEPGVTLTSNYFIHHNIKYIRYRTTSFPASCVMLAPVSHIYHSSSIYPMTLFSGSPIIYKKVTKYQLDGMGVGKGKSEYEYNAYKDEVAGEMLNFVYFTKNDWRNGTLLRESHYKKDPGQDYQLVKTIENTYNEIKKSYIEDLIVKPLSTDLGTGSTRAAIFAEEDLEFRYVRLYTGANKLIKTKETIYGKPGTSPLVSITDHFYTADSHDFATKKTQTDSKGNVLSNTMKYPIDFSNSGNVYEKMVNKNIISPVVEQTYSRREMVGTTPTEVPLQTLKTEYRDWKNDQLVLAPEFIKASVNGATPENRVVYTNYNDRKQPTELKKNLDATISYLYGYNSQYVVAEVSNSPVSRVAYTSFEAGDKGGWSYGGTPIRDFTSPTGKLCYSYSGNIVSPTLTTGIAYIVSYWRKSGTVSISGSTTTTGRTANGWTYVEHRIASPGTTITVVGTSAVIDELRLYPATNVMMKTYAYDPLIGVINECDANNRILKYEYDELQRLVLIRDEDRNIVKKFAYKYNSHTAYDNIYYNDARSQTFQRMTACTGCNIGAMVTYSVPANTYLSTVSVAAANAVADGEIALNGQVHANTTGACVTPPTMTLQTTNAIAADFNFFNTCTSTNYNRPRPTPETNWSVSGIPQGTYNINVIKSTPPATSQYYEVIAPANTPSTLFYNGPNFLPFTNVKLLAGTNKVIIN